MSHTKVSSLLYTKGKHTDKETRATVPFSIVSEKSLGITVSKQVKDCYNKVFKRLKKEIEQDTRRWKYLSGTRIGRIHLVKITILSKS